jgi:excisionase family DNA binding protein
VAEHQHPTAGSEPAGTPAATGRRLALSKAEAAEALGVSVDFLERHVMPELPVVRRGRRRLIPVAVLEQWLDHNAERAPR